MISRLYNYSALVAIAIFVVMEGAALSTWALGILPERGALVMTYASVGMVSAWAGWAKSRLNRRD